MDFYYVAVSVSWQDKANWINVKKNLAYIQLSWPHSSRSITHMLAYVNSCFSSLLTTRDTSPGETFVFQQKTFYTDNAN